MKKITKEVKIALVAIVGIIVFYLGMNFLKGFIIVSNDSSYNIVFKQVDGLSISSPVFANGYRVGVVRSINYDYAESKGITVVIDVDRKLQIPKGSKAEVSADFMGNVKVNLLMADNPQERIQPGETIEGLVDGSALAEAAKLLPQIQQIVPKLDSIMTSINTLLADPAIANALHNTEAVTADLKTSTTEVNKLLSQLNTSVPSMLAKADKTLANTEQLTGNLATIDIASTMAQVNQTLTNVNEFTEKLNSSEGTIGKFLNDPSLYNNMNATMRSADSLVVDLKTNPKRYVHFSVFGKK